MLVVVYETLSLADNLLFLAESMDAVREIVLLWFCGVRKFVRLIRIGRHCAVYVSQLNLVCNSTSSFSKIVVIFACMYASLTVRFWPLA